MKKTIQAVILATAMTVGAYGSIAPAVAAPGPAGETESSVLASSSPENATSQQLRDLEKQLKASGARLVDESESNGIVTRTYAQDGNGGGRVVTKTTEPSRGGPGGGITPQWSVGVGWGLYLYLKPNEIRWLVGLGYAAGSAALCSMLAPTVVGAIACGAGSYVLWEAIAASAPQLPTGLNDAICVEYLIKGTAVEFKIVDPGRC